MIIQDIASNLHQRVERAGQTYRGIRQVWRETQREAMAIVTHNSRSVANTEIGAAKNIYTSAQAAFRRAKRDGLRKVAQRPSRYVPAGRKQTAAAYRATLKLLDRTRAELTDVASGGYKQLTAQLNGTTERPQPEQQPSSTEKEVGEARKRPAKRAAATAANRQTTRRRTARKRSAPPTTS
ncbi:hypothetical protein [Salinisphaera hydrothermalis]|uniref:Uncharacterized protein n=1 Tax=Salinisphaera hydrothermalis (strain C41B8) TaxID=1304275 RepID=A0A084IK30_SALHC|nr:hypothetical protein [Salinisphaera hydrothermalis]KEZ77064.1 hypothetical protein C41B8_11458 [Salinisphaera hydrothermalis C41B8]